MTGRLRLGAGLAAATLVTVACTGGTPTVHHPLPSAPAAAAVLFRNGDSADRALQRLCDVPHGPGSLGGGGSTRPPAAIAKVEREVQQTRGLKFKRPVRVVPVTAPQLAGELTRLTLKSAPVDQYRRRTQAWQTIGVFPKNTSLLEASKQFVTSGVVVGVYLNGALLFDGSSNPDPLQALTLAHELTHAIDDQNFGIEGEARLFEQCHDEAGAADRALIEGNAQFFSFRVGSKFLGIPDPTVIYSSYQVPATLVPSFLSQQGIFPYTVGVRFVSALYQRDGAKGVNDAFRHPPLSTEQIIHPSAYPKDVPVHVDVPDLGPALGSGWHDLDVQEVGEEWLSAMLRLRLPASAAADAAQGWGGGIYRAWTDGHGHTAVILSTSWDTITDAAQFKQAVQGWVKRGKGKTDAFVVGFEDHVAVGFASDRGTLAKLRTAAGA